MNELATVPTSLRLRLEQAQNLLASGQVDEAQQVARHAFSELARTQPEYCALLLAGSMGFRGIETTVVQRTTTMHRVQRTFFGIPIADEWVPITSTFSTTKRMRLF